MVKIIDETPDPSVVRRVICGGCGRRLEYTPIEVHRDYSTDYTGCKDYYNFINCPGCHNQVII